MKLCHKCGTEWDGEGKTPFRGTCTKCYSDLHCCLNCRLYDEGAHNNCRSSTTEFVSDTEKGNFCEEFEFRDTDAAAEDKASGDSAREKFERLFKK